MNENDGTITELLLLFRLYEIADKGYFIKIYQKYGIKTFEGTLADIRFELGYDYSSGFISNFIKKCINLGALKFIHNQEIRGKSIPLYTIDKDNLAKMLMKISIFKKTVEFIDKTSSLILGSEFKDMMEEK